jgi:hypothetical protein
MLASLYELAGLLCFGCQIVNDVVLIIVCGVFIEFSDQLGSAPLTVITWWWWWWWVGGTNGFIMVSLLVFHSFMSNAGLVPSPGTQFSEGCLCTVEYWVLTC